jgi:hypothetical protein
MEDSTIRILNGKPNKSDYVNLAVHKMHSKEMYWDISNASDRALWLEILYRMDVDDPLRPLIKARVPQDSTS